MKHLDFGVARLAREYLELAKLIERAAVEAAVSAKFALDCADAANQTEIPKPA